MKKMTVNKENKMNCKGIFLALALTLTASISFAEDGDGTASATYIHDHFTMMTIKGDAAKQTYDHLQTAEREVVNGVGEHFGSYSKNTADGRINCQRIPVGASRYAPAEQGTYSCTFTFDSVTGIIHQTYLN